MLCCTPKVITFQWNMTLTFDLWVWVCAPLVLGHSLIMNSYLQTRNQFGWYNISSLLYIPVSCQRGSSWFWLGPAELKQLTILVQFCNRPLEVLNWRCWCCLFSKFVSDVNIFIREEMLTLPRKPARRQRVFCAVSEKSFCLVLTAESEKCIESDRR